MESSVGRPKRQRCDIGQRVESRVRDLRHVVDREIRPVGIPQQIDPRVIKHSVGLQVWLQVGYRRDISEGFVLLAGPAVERIIENPEVLENTCRLCALARTQEAGHRNRRKKGDDRHHNHDLHEGKARAA